MAIESVHPQYTEFVDQWVMMRDLYRGERSVKLGGEKYLPATCGMVLDGMDSNQVGRKAYDAYKLRAVFHDCVRDAVESYIGMLHRKPPTIKLPSALESMRNNATVTGESLEMLLRRINEEQLVSGRAGLLLDIPVVPNEPKPSPYIAMYLAEAIRNWDDGESGEGQAALNMAVLDESGFIRSDDAFDWIAQKKYRVLMLGDDLANEQTGVYRVGVFSSSDGTLNYSKDRMTTPKRLGATLDSIPFVFVNTKDIVATPDEPPLAGLGRLALAIYRGEADYRQNLFMQGQDTLVIVGQQTRMDGASEDKPVRVGAGSSINLDTGGRAEYIGVSSAGLSEQRSALVDDRARADVKSGQLINATGNTAESGTALQTRVAAQTASLNQIAAAGAAALERVLKIAAKWVGANPDEVSVTPNLEFALRDLDGQDFVQLQTFKTIGGPLSKQSLHKIMMERGLTSIDYETEMELIADEAPVVGNGAANGSGAEDGQ